MAYIVILLIVFILIFIVLYKEAENSSGFQYPKYRYDERDIQFSRSELKSGTTEYLNYYRLYPDREAIDNKFRTLPGLLNEGSLYYNQILYHETKETFKKVELFHSRVCPRPNTNKVIQNSENLKSELKKEILGMGAVSVGFTLMQPIHYYQTLGRKERYGSEVQDMHQYGISFAVEMDRLIMKKAPAADVVFESSKKYLLAAEIGVKIAEELAGMGFSSRAHIDGNYEVIAPLVAMDSGLGVIGRMGLLMTPKYGPRVRLGVVTTDAPLVEDNPARDMGIIEFCYQCKKCASNCPVNAISFENPQNYSDGSFRWKIDSDRCFRWWNKAGTDCGICMSVCPFSNPSGGIHTMARWLVTRNGFNRKVLLKLDEIIESRILKE